MLFMQTLSAVQLYFRFFVGFFFFRRCPATQVLKWYKFDDGEVTEAKMDDEEVIGKVHRSQREGGREGEFYPQ